LPWGGENSCCACTGAMADRKTMRLKITGAMRDKQVMAKIPIDGGIRGVE
jgi:hypothetical protein